MGFIKKYMALIIPAAITLLAIILFIPTILSGRSLRAAIEKESVSQGQSISSKLRTIPSREQAWQERFYQNEHQKDIDKIVQLATNSSRRDLISYVVFPEPKDESQQIFDEYGTNYRKAIENLITNINALDAPSDIDIEKEAQAKGYDKFSKKRSSGGSSSSKKKRKTAKNEDESELALFDAVCSKRAETISVYTNPNAFKWYDFWEDYRFPGATAAVKDCWFSQVAYWVYEDVVATIGKMNAGSNTVYTSPVKRLIGVSFQKAAEYPTAKTLSAAVGDDPGYVLEGDEMSVLLVSPWTGRVCNDEIDVIHFSVSAILRADSVMAFMKELCSEKEHTFREGFTADGEIKAGRHNQITILKSQVASIELEQEDHEFYRYGNDAVVKVDLICEYIFNRKGYDSIKPKSIKEQLGQIKIETKKTTTKKSKSKSSGSKDSSIKDKKDLLDDI